MPNALVTGGAGFIGSHLCEHLQNKGFSVTCADNFSTGRRENLSHLTDIEIMEADVNQAGFWQDLGLRQFDLVFHYAATVGVRLTEEQPLKVLADAQGIQHLTQFAVNGQAKQIVFASSSEVYGDAEKLPSTETDPSIAWNPYTSIKIYGENMMRSLHDQYGIPAISLRFFNVYGPRQNGSDYGFVIGKFLETARQGLPFPIYGSGEQTRDFMFVRDNVSYALALTKIPAAAGKVINIGTGQETSINQAARAIAESIQKPFLSLEHLPARQHDVRRRCASNKLLRALLGQDIRLTPFADGVRQTWNWYQEHAAVNANIINQ